MRSAPAAMPVGWPEVSRFRRSEDTAVLESWSRGGVANACRSCGPETAELQSMLPLAVRGMGEMIRDDREARDLDVATQAMLSGFAGLPRRDLGASGELPLWNAAGLGGATFRMSPDPEDSPDPGEDGLPDTEMEDALDELQDSQEDAAEDGVFTPREIRRMDDALAAFQALNDTSPPALECADEYVIHWYEAEPECLSASGMVLEQLCNVPCIYDLEAPTPVEVAALTASLEIDTNGVADAAAWVDLITTSWTLLQQNLDLIEFIACVLTGNPGAGECIENKIMSQEPRIILDDELNPDHAMLAGVSPATTIAGGLLDPAVLILDPFSGLGSLIRSLIAPAAGAAVGPTHIRLFTNHSTSRARMHAWEVEPLCGAVALGGALLHEACHGCERDLFDGTFYPHESWSAFDRDCPFAQLMASCFDWMVVQRYQIDKVVDGEYGCCYDYSLDRVWMSADNYQPELTCPTPVPTEPPTESRGDRDLAYHDTTTMGPTRSVTFVDSLADFDAPDLGDFPGKA